MIDTHAHLDYPQYDGDRREVLSRAWDSGLTAIITVGTDDDASRRAVSLAESNPRIYAAVGLHPHEAGKVNDRIMAALEELARRPRVVAVGETGLDYHHPTPPSAAQEDVFRKHIHLARDAGLPLIIHSRDAHDEVMSMLRLEGGREIGGVMHCFAGDREAAEEALELGFHISFSGILTFKNAVTTKEVARHVPSDRLLVETDCPFLSPHPFRGQRNEPARVSLVVRELARLKELSVEEMAVTTTANARRLFSLNGDGT